MCRGNWRRDVWGVLKVRMEGGGNGNRNDDLLLCSS